MKAMGEDSVSNLMALQKKSHHFHQRWTNEVFKHERDILHRVFARHEARRTRIGMNAEDLQDFITALPSDYQSRFQRLGSFNVLRGDTSVIDHENMTSALDMFAEMETKDVDIEFRIEKVLSVRINDLEMMKSIEQDPELDNHLSPQVFERKVVVTRRSRAHHTLDGAETTR